MYEEFAANRADQMSKLDSKLLPVVRAALAQYGKKPDWYAPIIDKAKELGGDAVDRRTLRSSLSKTKDPENTSGNTDERLAEQVSTYIVNATEHSKGDPDGTKTWVTRHDDRVRHTHAELDGVTVPQKDKFKVGDERLSYPGEPVGDPAAWINCRCVLKTTKGSEMSLTADLGPNKDPENDIPTADPADLPAENPDDPKIEPDAETPFHGVATVTDRPTGDRRQLAGTGFATRPLPLPLFYQRAQSEGHDGGTIVGQMTRIELVGDQVEFDGHFNYTPEAGEAIQGVAEQWLRGVSVDLDDVIIDYSDMDVAVAGLGEEDTRKPSEIMDEEQRRVTTMKEWRVSGLTMVGIPAFHEAFIKLGTRADAAAADAHEEPVATKDEQALVASAFTVHSTFAPGTHDGPGWITAPIPTGRIRRYWTHGEGAAKIKWGAAGDFNRCRTQLAKYIENPDWLAGACANMHKEATGGWPGHAPTEASILDQASMVASAFSLVASARQRELPPVEWFQNPNLSGPTPITIDGDRIFGHIATWGTCHIGMQGVCTTAPRSNTDYSWFRLGAVETTGGLVPVGQITMDTGHEENPRAAAAVTVAHYDNTGFAAADIAAGEDDWGIWFSGRLRPGLDQDHRDSLLAAKLSGDWRDVHGNLELVAALAVNTPGFGIPRLALAASGAQQVSLVAAGIVDVDHTDGPDQVVVDPAWMERIRELEQRVADRDRRDKLAALPERTARLRELAATRRHDRIDAARARLRKDV